MTIQMNTKFVDAQTLSPLEQDQRLTPSPFDFKERQALHQRTKKEVMALIPSLAKEEAKNSGQATLDIHRIQEAGRVVSETLVSVTNTMARIDTYSQRLVEQYPELEARIQQMIQEQDDLLSQLPRIATVGYLRRYHQIDH